MLCVVLTAHIGRSSQVWGAMQFFCPSVFDAEQPKHASGHLAPVGQGRAQLPFSRQ
jgi:hypothetical protein